jgi:DNA-binding CsgD family transcriptional regulator
MEHLPVLFNLLSLLLGAVCFARLLGGWLRERRGTSLSLLAFFSVYTYLLVAAALFAYWTVNVSSATDVERLFAGTVFIGMAGLSYTMPWMAMAQAGRPFRGWRRIVAGAVAAFTVVQAFFTWFVLAETELWVGMVLAFAPFLAALGWTLALAVRHKDRGRVFPAWFFLCYVPVGALAAWEAVSLASHPAGERFVSIGLPAAYLVTSLQFIWAGSRAGRVGGNAAPEGPTAAPAMAIGDALAARWGLTPRETEIARAILAGKANKEIAYELSLSENTVRNHIYKLYQKLGIQKRMDLVRLAQVPGTNIPGDDGGFGA